MKMKRYESFRKRVGENIEIINKEIKFSEDYIHSKQLFESYRDAKIVDFDDAQLDEFTNWIRTNLDFLGAKLKYFDEFMHFLGQNTLAKIDEIKLTYIKRQLHSSSLEIMIPEYEYEIDRLKENKLEDYLEKICQQIFNKMMVEIEKDYVERYKKYDTDEYKAELRSTRDRYKQYLEFFSDDEVKHSFNSQEMMTLMNDLSNIGVDDMFNFLSEIITATGVETRTRAPIIVEKGEGQPLTSSESSGVAEVIEDTRPNEKPVETTVPVIVEERDKVSLFNSLRDDARRTLNKLKEINKNISIALTRGVSDSEYREYLTETLGNSAAAINSIENDIQPMIETIINGLDSKEYDDDDNYYYELVETPLIEYKAIIAEWYRRQNAMRQDNVQPNNNYQSTENLVMCVDNSLDLSDEGIRKEFEGIIKKLEYRSSINLYKDSNRKGLLSLEKSTSTNKRGDFITFLEKTFGPVDFEPLLISSTTTHRTGIIKFNPTQAVKDHLESRYGISKTAACLGIFAIISADGSDHSGYSILENYVVSNYAQIEDIARLFASDNPDYERLDAVVDRMIEIKKEKLDTLKQGTMRI